MSYFYSFLLKQSDKKKFYHTANILWEKTETNKNREIYMMKGTVEKIENIEEE
jgi:hypothetical protein